MEPAIIRAICPQVAGRLQFLSWSVSVTALPDAQSSGHALCSATTEAGMAWTSSGSAKLTWITPTGESDIENNRFIAKKFAVGSALMVKTKRLRLGEPSESLGKKV